MACVKEEGWAISKGSRQTLRMWVITGVPNRALSRTELHKGCPSRPDQGTCEMTEAGERAGGRAGCQPFQGGRSREGQSTLIEKGREKGRGRVKCEDRRRRRFCLRRAQPAALTQD